MSLFCFGNISYEGTTQKIPSFGNILYEATRSHYILFIKSGFDDEDFIEINYDKIINTLSENYDIVFDAGNTDLYNGSYKNIFKLATEGKLCVLKGGDDASYTLIWNLETNNVDFYDGHDSTGKLIQHINIDEYIETIDSGKKYKLLNGYDFTHQTESKKGKRISPKLERSASPITKRSLQKNIVYIVSLYNTTEFNEIKVFSTLKKAKDYMKKNPLEDEDYCYEIYEENVE